VFSVGDTGTEIQRVRVFLKGLLNGKKRNSLLCSIVQSNTAAVNPPSYDVQLLLKLCLRVVDSSDYFGG